MTSERVGAESIPAFFRICQTVDAAIVVAEPSQFAVDAAVAPGRILSCEAQCESAKLRRGRRPARRSMWLGPVPDDAAPVPTQQRVGGDQPPDSARSL